MYFATLRKSHYVIIIEKTLYKVVNFQNELILYFELLALGSRGILLIWDSCGSIQNFDWLKSKHFYDNVFNTFKLFRLCHSKLCNLVISNSLTFLPLKIIKNFYPPTTSEIASGPMNVCDINQLIIMLCHMTGEHIRFGQIWNLQACSSIEGFRDFLKSKSRKYLRQGETASL